MSFETQIPSWTIVVFAAIFWAIQYSLKRFVRLWAFVTLPATMLHELAHALVGFVLAARPSNFNLWPKRVTASAWRLGYVAFQRLHWWNGGAVALAPSTWLLLILVLARYVPTLPVTIALQTSLVFGVAAIWLGIAAAPSRSDWAMAFRYWPSALAYLLAWFSILYCLLLEWL
jgi:hypothetical protein